MAFHPSPGPWEIKDYEGRAYQVVAADGTVVALMYYPKGAAEVANCKLIELSSKLYDQFKRQIGFLESVLRGARIDPEKSPQLAAARALLAELEIRGPLKEPPLGPGG